jgi:hypothetical protein
MIRSWLAALLRGECPPWAFGPDQDLARIVERADQEGVVALIHECLLDPKLAAVVPPELRERFTAAARAKAAQSLMREGECRRVLARLEQAGLPVLLLKGSALAYWAYPSPYLRECGDIDLLFRSRADVDRVVTILADLGFDLRERTLPGDLVCFELTCTRGSQAAPGLEIDLHWQLSSGPMFAFRFDFQTLWSASIALPRLAPSARGLSPVHAYLHASMHRVQNMVCGNEDVLKWLFDLKVLGDGFAASDWQQLAETALERGLAGVCGSAMDASAAVFRERVPARVRATLQEAARNEIMDVARMHQWSYIEWMNFRAFSSAGQRARWLRQRVLPDLAYLRERYGNGRGALSLMATRLRAGLRRLGG